MANRDISIMARLPRADLYNIASVREWFTLRYEALTLDSSQTTKTLAFIACVAVTAKQLIGEAEWSKHSLRGQLVDSISQSIRASTVSFEAESALSAILATMALPAWGQSSSFAVRKAGNNVAAALVHFETKHTQQGQELFMKGSVREVTSAFIAPLVLGGDETFSSAWLSTIGMALARTAASWDCPGASADVSFTLQGQSSQKTTLHHFGVAQMPVMRQVGIEHQIRKHAPFAQDSLSFFLKNAVVSKASRESAEGDMSLVFLSTDLWPRAFTEFVEVTSSPLTPLTFLLFPRFLNSTAGEQVQVTMSHAPLRGDKCGTSASCALRCLIWDRQLETWSAEGVTTSQDDLGNPFDLTCSLSLLHLPSRSSPGLVENRVVALSVWQVAVATESTALLSPSLDAVHMYISDQHDLGGHTVGRSIACESVLSAASLLVLGNDACRAVWTRDTSGQWLGQLPYLIIRPDAERMDSLRLDPLVNIEIKGNTIKSLVTGKYLSASSILSLPVPVPTELVPVARIAAFPKLLLDYCDDLHLSATGSSGAAGKAMQFAWNIVSEGGGSVPTSFHEQKHRAFIILRSSGLIPDSYSVSVTVTNWLGLSASQELKFTKVDSTQFLAPVVSAPEHVAYSLDWETVVAPSLTFQVHVFSSTACVENDGYIPALELHWDLLVAGNIMPINQQSSVSPMSRLPAIELPPRDLAFEVSIPAAIFSSVISTTQVEVQVHARLLATMPGNASLPRMYPVDSFATTTITLLQQLPPHIKLASLQVFNIRGKSSLAIKLVFDIPTDKGSKRLAELTATQVQNMGGCELYLTADTLQHATRLGLVDAADMNACEWDVDPSVLWIPIHDKVSVARMVRQSLDLSIELRPGSLRSASGRSPPNELGQIIVNIGGKLSPFTSHVSCPLLAPDYLSSCHPLELTTSTLHLGEEGFPLALHWTVIPQDEFANLTSAGQKELSLLQKLLLEASAPPGLGAFSLTLPPREFEANYGARSLVVPAALLRALPGGYTFVLTATSWLNRTAVSAKSIERPGLHGKTKTESLQGAPRDLGERFLSIKIDSPQNPFELDTESILVSIDSNYCPDAEEQKGFVWSALRPSSLGAFASVSPPFLLAADNKSICFNPKSLVQNAVYSLEVSWNGLIASATLAAGQAEPLLLTVNWMEGWEGSILLFGFNAQLAGSFDSGVAADPSGFGWRSCDQKLGKLAPATLGRVVSASSCVWLSATTLALQMESGSSLLPGDVLHTELSFYASAETQQVPPLPLDSLSIVSAELASAANLDVATGAGACGHMVLDGTRSRGGQGKALQVSWLLVSAMVTSSGENNNPKIPNLDPLLLEALSEHLNAASSLFLQIPFSVFPSNQEFPHGSIVLYTFSLAVSNWLGNSSQTSSSISFSRPLPSLPVQHSNFSKKMSSAPGSASDLGSSCTRGTILPPPRPQGALALSGASLLVSSTLVWSSAELWSESTSLDWTRRCDIQPEIPRFDFTWRVIDVRPVPELFVARPSEYGSRARAEALDAIHMWENSGGFGNGAAAEVAMEALARGFQYELEVTVNHPQKVSPSQQRRLERDGAQCAERASLSARVVLQPPSWLSFLSNTILRSRDRMFVHILGGSHRLFSVAKDPRGSNSGLTRFFRLDGVAVDRAFPQTQPAVEWTWSCFVCSDLKSIALSTNPSLVLSLDALWGVVSAHTGTNGAGEMHEIDVVFSLTATSSDSVLHPSGTSASVVKTASVRVTFTPLVLVVTKEVIVDAQLQMGLPPLAPNSPIGFPAPFPLSSSHPQGMSGAPGSESILLVRGDLPLILRASSRNDRQDLEYVWVCASATCFNLNQQAQDIENNEIILSGTSSSLVLSAFTLTPGVEYKFELRMFPKSGPMTYKRALKERSLRQCLGAMLSTEELPQWDWGFTSVRLIAALPPRLGECSANSISSFSQASVFELVCVGWEGGLNSNVEGPNLHFTFFTEGLPVTSSWRQTLEMSVSGELPGPSSAIPLTRPSTSPFAQVVIPYPISAHDGTAASDVLLWAEIRSARGAVTWHPFVATIPAPMPGQALDTELLLSDMARLLNQSRSMDFVQTAFLLANNPIDLTKAQVMSFLSSTTDLVSNLTAMSTISHVELVSLVSISNAVLSQSTYSLSRSSRQAALTLLENFLTSFSTRASFGAAAKKQAEEIMWMFAVLVQQENHENVPRQSERLVSALGAMMLTSCSDRVPQLKPKASLVPPLLVQTTSTVVKSMNYSCAPLFDRRVLFVNQVGRITDSNYGTSLHVSAVTLPFNFFSRILPLAQHGGISQSQTVLALTAAEASQLQVSASSALRVVFEILIDPEFYLQGHHELSSEWAPDQKQTIALCSVWDPSDELWTTSSCFTGPMNRSTHSVTCTCDLPSNHVHPHFYVVRRVLVAPEITVSFDWETIFRGKTVFYVHVVLFALYMICICLGMAWDTRNSRRKTLQERMTTDWGQFPPGAVFKRCKRLQKQQHILSLYGGPIRSSYSTAARTSALYGACMISLATCAYFRGPDRYKQHSTEEAVHSLTPDMPANELCPRLCIVGTAVSFSFVACVTVALLLNRGPATFIDIVNGDEEDCFKDNADSFSSTESSESTMDGSLTPGRSAHPQALDEPPVSLEISDDEESQKSCVVENNHLDTRSAGKTSQKISPYKTLMERNCVERFLLLRIFWTKEDHQIDEKRPRCHKVRIFAGWVLLLIYVVGGTITSLFFQVFFNFDSIAVLDFILDSVISVSILFGLQFMLICVQSLLLSCSMGRGNCLAAPTKGCLRCVVFPIRCLQLLGFKLLRRRSLVSAAADPTEEAGGDKEDGRLEVGDNQKDPSPITISTSGYNSSDSFPDEETNVGDETATTDLCGNYEPKRYLPEKSSSGVVVHSLQARQLSTRKLFRESASESDVSSEERDRMLRHHRSSGIQAEVKLKNGREQITSRDPSFVLRKRNVGEGVPKRSAGRGSNRTRRRELLMPPSRRKPVLPQSV